MSADALVIALVVGVFVSTGLVNLFLDVYQDGGDA